MAESPPSDDLFADSTMTFGEHLEELRHCLVRSLLALLVGTVCGLAFSDWVVQVVNGPLEQSLQGYYQSAAVARYEAFLLEQEAKGLTVPYSLAQVEDFVDRQHYIYRMYFVHPAAVRTELGLNGRGQEPVDREQLNSESKTAHAAKTIPSPEEVPFVEKKLLSPGDLVPLFVWRPMDDDERMSVKSLSPTEAFMIWLKAAVVSGFVLASPVIFYFIWSFVFISKLDMSTKLDG